MARVVVCGGSVIGLCTAVMLARDGHEVTVLESDVDPPPGTAEQAWGRWERAGVSQFRQPHNLFARFRQVCDQELPGLTERLLAAGCVWVDYLDPLPPSLTDRSPRPDDDRLRFITGRRPVVESVVAGLAADERGVTVRRGTRVAALVPGATVRRGVPHVAGVCTDRGEELRAELVVDATGRRTPSGTWLTDLGGRPPYSTAEDRGFVYYTRYFTGPQPPVLRGPALMPIGTITLLTLCGDNDTWSVTVYGLTGDAALKQLRRPDVFERVLRACPAQAHWLAGRPITGVLPMAGILDKYRRFVVDGAPIVTGFAAVGDAWACTNPSAGRGLSVGMIQAQQLRHVVRARLDDPAGFAEAWDERTERVVAPYYWNQVAADRARIAEMTALRDGVAPPPGEPQRPTLFTAATRDPDVFRAFMETVMCLALPQEVVARPDIQAKIERIEVTRGRRMPGPDREELLRLLAA